MSRRLPAIAFLAVAALTSGAVLAMAVGGADRPQAPASDGWQVAASNLALASDPSRGAAGPPSGGVARSESSPAAPVDLPTTLRPTAAPESENTAPESTPAVGEPSSPPISEAVPVHSNVDSTPSPGQPRSTVPAVAVPAVRIVPVPASQVRVVSHGSRQNKVVALTFDDGYSAVATIQILQVLLRDKVSATFFPYGWAVHATSPAWHAVVQAGMPIGNHTLSHADLANLTPDQVTDQLVRGREAIDAWSGGTSIDLMRPPYGAYSRANIPAIGAAGYGTVVLWDVDTLDWTGNSVSTIISRATHGTNGSIILMHAGPANTPKALPAIIAWYRAHGFTFVTVPQLLGISGE